MSAAVDKYLRRWAVAPPRVAEIVRERYLAAVVVPARSETADFVERVVPAGEGVLLVVVVNGSDGDPEPVHAENRSLFEALTGRGAIEGRAEGASWVRGRPHDLLVLDHASEGRRFGPRQGVGLARRLGLDTALRLHAQGLLESAWLHTTDADAQLPSSHVRDLPTEAVARVASFWHTPGPDEAVNEATALYEIWLRAWVVGLGLARSPWAYHTIGSCISVHTEAYAAVRGVPDRQAGEDFHLLAKLATIGLVDNASANPVRLDSRLSARVPFGTGPAVARLLSGEPLHLHDPRVFAALLQVHEGARRFARDPSADPLAAMPKDEAVRHALVEIGWPNAMNELRARGPITLRRVQEWLGARRTLRLVHALRDRAYPMLPWRDALAAAPVFQADTSDLTAVRRALQRLEPPASRPTCEAGSRTTRSRVTED